MKCRALIAVVTTTLAVVTSVRAAAAEKVYASSFADKVGPEWSIDKVDQTPQGGRKFLGQFIGEQASLSLARLPAHRYLRVSFDLMIILTWDGSTTRLAGDRTPQGPDFFRLWVERGPNLMWQTFSNSPPDSDFGDDTKVQTYPSPVPGDRCPAATGSAERQSLGYVWPRNEAKVDAVYRISLTFPHAADAVRLNFAASGLTPPSGARIDESWGLERVTLETLNDDEVTRVTGGDAAALLEVAAGPDPVKAAEAFWKLAAGGKQVAAAASEAFHAAGLDNNEVHDALADLATAADAADEDARKAAAARLVKVGPLIELQAWESLKNNASVAYRKNLEAVLRQVGVAPIDDPTLRKAAVACRLLSILPDDESPPANGGNAEKPPAEQR